MIINNSTTSVEVKLNKLGLNIDHFCKEKESLEYSACRFSINDKNYIYRKSKITPKKIGQFVTFWKRNKDKITQPLQSIDNFEFYLIYLLKEDKEGYFIFPKSELVKNKIISTPTQAGKRGFRVYPPWDFPKSKQAIKTQEWQVKHFYSIDKIVDILNR